MWVTRSFARVEAHTLKAAWKNGLLKTALPAAQGSRLPYILPLTVGPIVLFIAAIVESADASRQMRGMLVGEAIASGFAGLVFFLGGFMLEDWRQFNWRQTAPWRTRARRAPVDTARRAAPRFHCWAFYLR